MNQCMKQNEIHFKYSVKRLQFLVIDTLYKGRVDRNGERGGDRMSVELLISVDFGRYMFSFQCLHVHL